jgi:hypothetical protein
MEQIAAAGAGFRLLTESVDTTTPARPPRNGLPEDL